MIYRLKDSINLSFKDADNVLDIIVEGYSIRYCILSMFYGPFLIKTCFKN